jgi:hypothetical protein
MRLVLVGAGLIGLAASLSACVAPDGSTPLELARVDPQDAADRALIGGVLGAALGTGLGASFAINPAIGSVVGVEAGAAIGAAIGVMTAQPLPAYRPIAVPQEAVIPGFYDTWPPGSGSHPPPIAAQTPPPKPG